MIKTFQIKKRFSHNRYSHNEKKRLSCEELESLKERFVDFIDSSELPSPPDTNQLSRLSMSSESSISLCKPEPPMRTVSIKNLDDTMSIKSIYSSCRGSLLNQTNLVRVSRSVFSIYEEEDENSSMITSSSSSNSSSSRSRLERLSDFETEKIECMYRSIGCMVSVGQSTCDLYTTTSDQIADCLNNCWKVYFTGVVPVLVFDTGYSPNRDKQLRLVFADRHTGLPMIENLIQLDRSNTLKYPNIEKKCLTFRLNELICLIRFYDYFSCSEFFRFYSSICERNGDLLNGQAKLTSSLKNKNNKSSRYSDFESVADVLKSDKRPSSKHETISKHFISGPCAFQHVNSIKNDDFNFKNLLDSFNDCGNLFTHELDKKNLKKKVN